MVLVDTVYQKVLSLANKEQRGYITPQEFNLLADKAQVEIFENYFHDIKTAYHKPKNQMGVGFDEIEMVQEKLHPFHEEDTIIQAAGDNTLDLSTLNPSVYYMNTLSIDGFREVTELTRKEIMGTQGHPLLEATTERMVYDRRSDSILRLYPSPLLVQTTFAIEYWRRPHPPEWGYVVLDEKALYNVNTSENFELHISEEENLVTRILELSGIVINKPGLSQVALQDKTLTKQEQNS